MKLKKKDLFFNGFPFIENLLMIWYFQGKEIKDVIKLSIDLGYRLIDTAFVYANEKEIGEGIAEKIKDGTVKREDLFVVTKVFGDYQRHNLSTAFILI